MRGGMWPEGAGRAPEVCRTGACVPMISGALTMRAGAIGGAPVDAAVVVNV